MINFLKILVSQISYNERLTIIQIIVFFLIFFVLFLIGLLMLKVRKKQLSYKKIGYISLLWTLGLSVISLGTKIMYQNNIWSVQTNALNYVQRYKQHESDRKDKFDDSSRIDISKMVMHQAVKGLDKQGFISIPSRNILLPVYNDAYSDKGLNAGANYANKSVIDPTGEHKPIMGEGNYGLAAHNFNDGQTGFSGLQQYTNHDSPYLQNGHLKGSDWLNGQKILLANAHGIYDYRITGQTLVTNKKISVLNPTQTAQVTIISCLFPSTDYRIITHGKLKNIYTWDNAPRKLVNEFNLKEKNTNAHASWWNPGVEEGANGQKGGTE